MGRRWLPLVLLIGACLVRSFSPGFTTQKNSKATPAPFMTVVYRFAEGDLWLSERGRPTTIDGNVMNPIVISFGQIGAALSRAPEIVDIGDTTISFVNFPVLIGAHAGRSFSDMLGSDIEAVVVDFYANFLLPDDTVVSEIFASGVSRFNFRDESAFFDEEVGAVVVKALTEKWWERNVLRTATLAEYPNIGTDSVGKNFALSMGDAVKVPGLRLDATADRFTVAESDPGNPVVSIGQLYWNGHPFVEEDVAFSIPIGADLFNLDLESGVANAGRVRGQVGSYFNGGGSGAPVYLTPSSASGSQVDFYDPFMPKQDTILTGIFITLQGTATSGTQVAQGITMLVEDGDGNILQERQVAIRNGSVVVPFYLPTKMGRRYFAHILFDSEALGAGIQIAGAGAQIGVGGTLAEYLGEYAVAGGGGRHPLSTFPGGSAAAIFMEFEGIPLGSSANLAADADPLGAAATTAGMVSDELESPGIVLEAIRIGARAPLSPDDRLVGDLKVEIFSLQNGQTTSICSVGITSDEFMDALDDPHRGTYVQFYQTLAEPLFLPAGPIQVAISNEISRQQMEAAQAAVDTTGSALLFTSSSSWRLQGAAVAGGPVRALYLLPAPHFAAASPIPALGEGNVPIKLDVLLYAMKFDRFPNAAVQPTEGATGAFNVAAVKPQDGPYRISETRRVPIPEGVAIAGDLACTYSRCDQVIRAQANRAGAPDGRIDLAGSFAASGTKYAAHGYRFDGAVTTQQTYKTLFAREGFECRSVPDWQWDKMQLKWTPSRSEVTASVKTFTRANMLPKAENSPVLSLKVKRTIESEIVNLIRARWNRDLNDGSYHAAERFDSPPSITVHGELSRDDLFDFLYVRSDAMIADVCANKLERMAYSKRLFEWEAFLDALGMEREDAIDFNVAVAGGGGGGSGGIGEGGVGEGGWGGGSRVFAGLAPGTFSLIESVNYSWADFKTIQLRAREM